MDRLFLGINSHVVCIDKKAGTELWRTKLKSSTITNVCCDEGKLFAYAGGHLFCLNADSGAIIWENPLKGLGYRTCIIANEGQSTSVVSQVDANQQAAAVAGIAAATVVTTG
ncbi:MAG: PQQ-binding-like beta-propeller repeat protein [Gammaproteobacteria bacterium]|nr:PQQ-binding-like beta-propeller repeat protein [Gammaproteobacteria bacterium]NVK86584.1 PQQ-binding-like beta-propeller repeat protein [Gammaproteobacteria bacterium]